MQLSSLTVSDNSLVPITAAVAPDTGRPYVKTFAKLVTRASFKAGPPASVTTVLAGKMAAAATSAGDCHRPAAIGFGTRPPPKPNFAESGPLLTAAVDGSRLVASVFGARPPAKPNYAEAAITESDPLLFLSLLTAHYLLLFPLLLALLQLDSLLARPSQRWGLLPSGTPNQVAAQPQQLGGIGSIVVWMVV